MFTASHNPAAVQRHQAVPRVRRPCRPGPVSPRSATASRDGTAVPTAERGAVSERDVLAEYAAYLLELVPVTDAG